MLKEGIRIGELMCAQTVGDNLLLELSRSVNRLYTQEACFITWGWGALVVSGLVCVCVCVRGLEL